MRGSPQKPSGKRLICAPGNGGISNIAECVPVKATDIPGMLKLAGERGVDFVVVALMILLHWYG